MTGRRRGVITPVRRRSRPKAEETSDEDAVATVLRDLVEAWNRGDAGVFGGAFGPSATYVTGAGQEVRGRAAIADLVRRARVVVEIVGDVKVQCSGAAGVARFGWTSTGGQRPRRSGTIACALEREGRAWSIRRLTNEERQEWRDHQAGAGRRRR